MSETEIKRGKRKPKLRLPFNDKKGDIGEWAFDHRVGLCVTVILYLILSIVFVGAKIFVGSQPHSQGFYVDIEDIAALEELRDKLQEEVSQKDALDWESVSNKASNENSLDEHVTDDRGTNTTELSNQAAKSQAEMEANRKAYEDAINKIEEEREQSRNAGKGEQRERRDIKQRGNVTVSYSFSEPVRHAQNLIVPAYQCQGGGEVVVEAHLDQSGKVIKAEVIRGGDRCMQETALKAAKGSSFNSSSSAPSLHKGTITYIFIPQ